MPSSITLRVEYILFSALFLTACSPLWATTPGTATPAVKTAHAVSAHKARERAVQQWIRARADYEKTLDYSDLEQEHEYTTMLALAEAKYFLMLADTDLIFNTDKSVALDDFNQARELLEKAASTTSTANKKKLETIHRQLDKMRLAVKSDINAETRWLPVDQRAEFDSIQTRIEKILNMR